jgi:capsular polysaccharide transport system permease protein
VESEQAGKPIGSAPDADTETSPGQEPSVSQREPRSDRAERRMLGRRRREKLIGPALKTVPERRAEIGRAQNPAVTDGRAPPIRMPNEGAPPLVLRPAISQPIDAGLAVRPPATRAGIKPRHRLALYSFLLFVILPVALMAGYLFVFAQPQYASEAGFSVRKEEGATTTDVIGGLTQLTGSASTDAEILYDFIRSSDLVARIDKDIDLTSIYARNYDQDPLFSLMADANIEEKHAFWERVVNVEYNESTGLIKLEVRAFEPEEAQKIGNAIIGYSSVMINRLAEAAREDATRYARNELARAGLKLKEIRVAITDFRSRNKLVDPLADVQGQMGLMNKLEEELASAMIDLDVLKEVARENDSRLPPMEIRIAKIEKRLEDERAKFGFGTGEYAQIVAEYEGLIVDRQVAEEAFRSATLIFDAAQAEANRKSRYLAAYIEPTLAESAIYPNFSLIILMTAFFLVLAWALLILIFYSIRDRR